MMSSCTSSASVSAVIVDPFPRPFVEAGCPLRPTLGSSFFANHLIGREPGTDYNSLRIGTGVRWGANLHPGNGYDLTGEGSARILARPNAFDLPGRARTR